MTDQPISEVFALFAEWARVNDVKALADKPGLFKTKIGEFDFALNPHLEILEDIPPYSLAITQNGWPLGCLSPFDGLMMAHAEDDVIAALKAAIAEKEGR